jgi:hypothetical protein
MDSSFIFEKSDTSNSIYYFGKAWEYFQYGNGIGLAYYTNKDSIVYVDGTAGHDGITALVYYTH